ncbi:MFS transporter [Streptomyces huiliensis]|uniref:MFS transporter n=1 Tax=Streptomyces huiliensis TaxID=2876027 RepID=UPI001CBCCB2A|nr:MFS transporter [Streptomyces huiliensis]MBZ4319569.1 MFS transporter [Streptomyces huiliensis]
MRIPVRSPERERTDGGEAAPPGIGGRFVAAVAVGSMLNPVNSTMISTALVPIGRSFGAGPSATVWLVAGLYLASAVAQPVMGRVADHLGARRVYTAGLVLVGLSGAAGLVAGSLGQLVAVRVLTGVGTSAAYPAAMAMIRTRSARAPGGAPARALGALTVAALASAALGPALGGLLTGLAGWRAVFAVNIPLALAGLVLALAWLPGDEPRAREGGARGLWSELDPAGVLLFAGTLLPLMFFLTDLARPDWPLLAVGAVAAGALAAWELRAARHPFLNLRMLAANRPLVRTYVRYGASFLVVYCVLYGYTQWLEEARGFSAAVTGVIMLPMCAVAALCSWTAARRATVRGPLLLGTAAMVAASAALLFVGPGTPTALLVLVGVVFGLPNGLNAAGNQAALYAQAPAGATGTAAGLFRTAQYVGAVASTSVIGLVYGDRATTGGLHTAAVVLTVLAALLLPATLLDRALRRAGR